MDQESKDEPRTAPEDLCETGGLVSSLRDGDRIVLDGDIDIQVMSARPGRVQLYIKAPKYVRIDRIKRPQST